VTLRALRLLTSPAELAGRLAQAMAAARERGGWRPRSELPKSADRHPALPFPSPSDEAVARAYAARPRERGALLAHADGLVAGRFDLLGYRALDFGSPVDWHRDPVSGRRAPLAHWSRVPYLRAEAVGDHKVIWELNRCQFLVTLAQAFRLTGDPRYRNTLAGLVESWLDANPPTRGINWASSLEVAFRAIAWTWALHILGPGARLPAALLDRMVRALDLHGRHIERYLSTWFSPNTHLTGEALGLLYLGTAFPDLRRAGRWRRLGARILLDQLPRQVRPDGTYFEQSSWYQAYTVEFYTHALRLFGPAGVEPGPPAQDRIRSAARVLSHLARDGGTVPLLGDDDGGRLLPLAAPPHTAFDDALAHAAAVLDVPHLAPPQPPAGAVWLLGDAWAAEAPGRRPFGAIAFPDGGWYVVRHADRSGTVHFVMDAGPHGALTGAHAHADALSFDLSLDGRPVIADPGAYLYHGPDREAFRATPAHSTLGLDNLSSAEPAGVFRWATFPTTTVAGWAAGPGFAWLDGRHDGYARVGGPAHRRVYLWVAGWGLLVLDQLPGDLAGMQPAIRFHLAPGVAASPAAPDRLRLGAADMVLAELVGDGDDPVILDSAWGSSCYGARSPTVVAVRRPAASRMAEGVATLIAFPDGADARLGRAERGGVTGWAWRSAAGEAFVSLRPDGVDWEMLEGAPAGPGARRSFRGVEH
jgi:hypothetical protein